MPLCKCQGVQSWVDLGSRLFERSLFEETPSGPSTAGVASPGRAGTRVAFGIFSLATQRKDTRLPGLDPATCIEVCGRSSHYLGKSHFDLHCLAFLLTPWFLGFRCFLLFELDVQRGLTKPSF